MTTADSPPALTTAHRDARRAACVMAGLGGAAVLVASLYGFYYLVPEAVRPPNVFIPGDTLAAALVAIGLLSAAWAVALAQLATPAGARALREALARLQRKGSERRVWMAAALLAGSYAALRLLTNPPTEDATLPMLTAGEAALPFQYRALVPWIVRSVHELFPGVDAFEFRLVYGVIEAAAALGVYAAFRFLLGSFWREPSSRGLVALAVFVPLFLNLAAPYRYNDLYFPWDTPSVMVFTLGLAALYRRDWWLFYPVFVLGTFNRETTCFLAVFYLLVFFREERLRRLLGHLSAQAVLWGIVKAGLWLCYAGNPTFDQGSGLFKSQLGRSLHLVAAPVSYLYLVIAMGGLWVVVLLLRRYVLDPRLRAGFRVVPVFLVGMFFVGELLEVRIYSELIPLVTVAALLAFRTLLAAPDGAAAPPGAPGGRVSAPSFAVAV